MTRCYAWPLTVTAGEDLQTARVDRAPGASASASSGAARGRGGAGAAETVTAAASCRSAGRTRPGAGHGTRSTLDAGLTDGIYLAVPVAGPRRRRTRAGRGRPEVATRRDACLFILRRELPSGRRKILYKLPTATYAAYNQLGGASLYAGASWVRDWSAQGYVASLQRPGNGGVGGRVMEGDAPDAYARGSRRQTFAHWDAPFVTWLESRGYQVSYCTDFDLHVRRHAARRRTPC